MKYLQTTIREVYREQVPTGSGIVGLSNRNLSSSIIDLLYNCSLPLCITTRWQSKNAVAATKRKTGFNLAFFLFLESAVMLFPRSFSVEPA